MARIALMAAAPTGAVYRLTLVGEVRAAERESGVLQVRVPGCSGCIVPPAPVLRNRLTLVGEVRAAERESGVLQVRVPGCSGCIVLPALNSTPE